MHSILQSFTLSTGTVVHLKQPFNATKINASGIISRVQELQKENNGGTGGSTNGVDDDRCEIKLS